MDIERADRYIDKRTAFAKRLRRFAALCHTAAHGKHRTGLFHALDPAQMPEHARFRRFPDAAGIKNYDIRIAYVIACGKTAVAQNAGYFLRLVNIHLATVGLYVKTAHALLIIQYPVENVQCFNSQMPRQMRRAWRIASPRNATDTAARRACSQNA